MELLIRYWSAKDTNFKNEKRKTKDTEVTYYEQVWEGSHTDPAQDAKASAWGSQKLEAWQRAHKVGTQTSEEDTSWLLRVALGGCGKIDSKNAKNKNKKMYCNQRKAAARMKCHCWGQ